MVQTPAFKISMTVIPQNLTEEHDKEFYDNNVLIAIII